ncbi:SDR family NAD(P)-dependent oxidoreductase [Aquimarina addita]|uniref:SDR family NAD(P)-dependent oxidoreductase n=1 Tax=Aquimarina addita TaxID=870485 RepID=A0ABP6UJW7_9FLAO
MRFKGKVIWITGASSGLGESMARAFNAEGANVILSARNVKELERVKNSFTNSDAQSIIIPFDVQKYNEAETIAQIAIKAFGRIDILVNNAGISQRSLAKDTSFKDELTVIEVDLIGTIALTKAVLTEIIKQKGQIVVISSVMGKINTKYRTAYAAAKHGVIGYFESLRLEMMEEGVNVLTILPGFIATNIVKNAIGTTYKITHNSQNNLGLQPDVFAKKALASIHKRKAYVYIGGYKEKMAMLLKRLSPSLFDKIIVNQKVT